jgi:uncharacterized protein (DUF2252 family)
VPIDLETPAPSLVQRALAGRDTRERMPRSVMAEWAPSADRSDPAQLLFSSEAKRMADLLPLRHERMSASAFAFYRGSAAIFAADMATLPHTNLRTQLCGDAHLANFGAHATPERDLVFSLNDFDETCPGPFEWDLKRLAASFEIAGRANGFSAAASSTTVTSVAVSYAQRMTELAAMPYLEVTGARLSIAEMISRWDAELSKVARERFARNLQKTRQKGNLQAMTKLTTVVDGELRFLNQPPLLERVVDLWGQENGAVTTERIRDALVGYRDTLSPFRRLLFDRYRLVDVARKVVGVGSVGTRCWVALFVGRDAGDPLFLQVKEANASVLEPYAGRSSYQHHGRRVVEGQRIQQAATDILLGWTRVMGNDGDYHDYYLRQLWDQKGSALLDQLDPVAMNVYARACGTALANAHARAGDPLAIAGYLGSGKTVGRAMATFARSYADQNDLDYARFVEAVRAL